MKKVVLLDFDGTLILRDTTRFLFVGLIKLRPWKVFGVAWFFIRMALSSDSNVTQNNKNKAIGYLIAGLSDVKMSKALSGFADKVTKLFRPLLINKIKEWNKDRVLILIVTASPSFAISKSVSDLPVYVIGTDFAKVSGKYSGKLESLNCYGEEKVKRIESWIEKRKYLVTYIEAWSDHFSDYPMLKMAEKRYWVGGKKLRNLVLDYDSQANFVNSE